jgi:hypothetical protein
VRVFGRETAVQVGTSTNLVVTCTDNRVVLGGGYLNPDTRGTSNTVLASYPSSDTQWTVQIFNPSGSATFAVIPYAVCAAVTQ